MKLAKKLWFLGSRSGSVGNSLKICGFWVSIIYRVVKGGVSKGRGFPNLP